MAIFKLSTSNGAGSTAPTAGRFAAVSGGTTSTYSSGGFTYQIQTFTSTGTLTVANSGVVDVLVVGGGGGGGGRIGGGGGGGQVISVTSYFLNSGSYSVTVGAAGTAGPTGTPSGNQQNSQASTGGSNGGLSQLADIKAIGGGGGTNSDAQKGFNGASGGGGSRGTVGVGGIGINCPLTQPSPLTASSGTSVL